MSKKSFAEYRRKWTLYSYLLAPAAALGGVGGGVMCEAIERKPEF